MKYPPYPWRAGLLVFLGLLAACARAEGPAFEMADGQQLEWKILRGEHVVINYWAEWCKPCIKEIPELNALNEDQDITVLGVNYDGVRGEDLQALGQKMNIEFMMLAEDPGPELGWDLPNGLPATFVLDPEGKLLDSLLGPQTEDDLRRVIEGS